MKLAVFSNVNLDMLAKQLSRAHEVFDVEGYGQWVRYALQPDPRLREFDPKAIFLLIDGSALTAHCESSVQGSQEVASALAHAGSMARTYSRATVFVSNIDIPVGRAKAAADEDWRPLWECEWAQGLYGLAGELGNVVPFDLKGIVCDMGRRAAYSTKMWYAGSIPYSLKGMDSIRESMCAEAEKLGRVRKKVLVVDLDNTLWGGAVGEEGPSGIVLAESGVGAAYRDAQKAMKEMACTGVLLAAASKNNPEDAEAAFAENPHMVLSREDFVAFKANWRPKAENVAEMAAELNLGADSFVFLDDNPVEREQMAMMLPEVTVAPFPDDVSRLPEAVKRVYDDYFWIGRRTREDAEKTQQYRDEAKRAAVREASASMEDYLRSLEMDVAVREAGDEQLNRLVQLLNKTNQFNTNTVRMDAQEMSGWMSRAGNHAFVANVSDRYGDSGLVSVMLVSIDGSVAVVENFLMSCRVMGREVERAFMAAVCQRLAESGVETVRASYVQSQKNKPVRDLYLRLGFSEAEHGEVEGAGGPALLYSLALPAEIDSVVEARWVR